MQPCKIWTGCVDASGYGRKSYQGKSYKLHRLTWELANGPIPDGMKVCHTCDTPPCYELTHLFLGSHKENMQDMISKGRAGFQKKTHCVHGHEYTAETTRVNKNGSRTCKVCQARKSAEWQKRNAEQLSQYNKAYYRRNRVVILAQKKNQLKAGE